MMSQPLPTEEEQMNSLMGEKTYSEEMQEELEPLPENLKWIQMKKWVIAI